MYVAKTPRFWIMPATRVFFFTISALLPALGQQLPDHRGPNQLAVELSAKKSIVIGEQLSLHIVVRNQSHEDLFIPRDLNEINDRLTLYLQHDTQSDTARSRGVGDYFGIAQVPFMVLLVRNWIALAPGMFYGGDVVMDSKEFPRLRIPGRYLVKCRYSSGGFRENLRGFDEDIGKLPFKAWEGQVESNSIWINVRSDKRNATPKSSQ